MNTANFVLCPAEATSCSSSSPSSTDCFVGAVRDIACYAKHYGSHTVYIPVMGTGFTIDTPLFVAKYGISAVISLVDDVLIEQMRKFWCEKLGEPYVAIASHDIDHRAKRITAYLNLLQNAIDKQVAQLRKAPFTSDSEITRYYEMLPDGELKSAYHGMLAETDLAAKARLQEKLRAAVVAGAADVNIMTKLDCAHYQDGQELPYEYCDAAAALRGFANSNVRSTMVFSAGFNPHLYGYAARFADFFPDENNNIKKQICLKVSDFRSAAVQGKYLAKRGLWVSEYRIESPLNCGGHAFINDGQLMGPILEEFKERKQELVASLHDLYKTALIGMKKHCPDMAQEVRITAQGGVGTHTEHQFLLNNYALSAVGWGSPFLLVPEVVNVDAEHLQKLLQATDKEVYLSASSPLNVPFWNLLNSASEEARCARVLQGKPGSPCVKGYTRFVQEPAITNKSICRASREYQKYKLAELHDMKEKEGLSEEEVTRRTDEITIKSCICHDLAGGVTGKHGIDVKATTAVCPGPNIVNFKKIMTLREMLDHIYGRCSVLANLANRERPHVFLREIELQLAYLTTEIKKTASGWPIRSQQKLLEVKENLSHGIDYYQKLVKTKAKEMLQGQQENFLNHLAELQQELEQLFAEVVPL